MIASAPAILESNSKKEIKIVGSFGPYASFDPEASEYVGEYNVSDDELNEEYNQETEEELLDIPTFLRRQAN